MALDLLREMLEREHERADLAETELATARAHATALREAVDALRAHVGRLEAEIAWLRGGGRASAA